MVPAPGFWLDARCAGQCVPWGIPLLRYRSGVVRRIRVSTTKRSRPAVWSSRFNSGFTKGQAFSPPLLLSYFQPTLTKMSSKDASAMKEEPMAVADPGQGLQVPVVTWYKHSGLRRLYLMMPLLFLGTLLTTLLDKARANNSRCYNQRLRWFPPERSADHGAMARMYNSHHHPRNRERC